MGTRLAALRERGRGALGLSLGGSITLQILGVLTGVLLARELGPTLRGELAAALLWPNLIIALGSLGVTEALSFSAARGAARVPDLVSTSAVMAFVQGTLLFLVGLATVPLVLSQHGDATVNASLVYLASIPFGLLALFFIYIFNGLHRFGMFNFLRVLVVLATAVGLVALAAAGELTVMTAAISYSAASVLTAAVAAVSLLRDAGLGTFSGELAREVLSFGWRSQLSSASNLLNERLDQLVISAFLPAADLGLYVVAYALTSPIGLVGISVTYVALPAVARAPDADRVATARRLVRTTLVLSLAAALPLAALAAPIIDLAFGESFSDATAAARILLLAGVALATSRVLGSVLKGANRPLDAGIAEGVGLGVTAVGLAVTLPLLGIEGAAWTSLLAYSAATVIALHRAGRVLGVHSWQLLIGAEKPREQG